MKTKTLTKRSIAVLLTTILLLVALPITTAFAATSGPNSAGSGASVSYTGADEGWLNTGNIVSSDNSYAQATLNSTDNATYYLQATNFSFSIPAGSTINGIAVTIERSSACVTTCTSTVSDSRIRIIKGGLVQSTDRSTGAAWPTTEAVAVFGTTSDLWGTTWTAADINACQLWRCNCGDP